MNQVVVDANIVVKTFLSEQDAQQTIDFFRVCVSKKISIIAPDILKYEVAQVAIKHKFPIEQVMEIFEQQFSVLLEIESPLSSVWLQAEKICQSGHEKSGFPTMYDSVYHAMAIINDGVFITADKRHYEKAKSFGHIAMLDSWEDALDKL